MYVPSPSVHRRHVLSQQLHKETSCFHFGREEVHVEKIKKLDPCPHTSDPKPFITFLLHQTAFRGENILLSALTRMETKAQRG